MPRGPQHRERIGHRELVRDEAVDRRGASSLASRRAALPGGLEQAAPLEHPAKVGGVDRVAERGAVDRAELGDGETLGRQRESDVRVRELGPQPLAAREDDRVVVEGEPARQVVDRVPRGIRRQRGVEAERHEAEIGRGELPLGRMALRIAERLELLEPGQLRHVDLAGQVGANRLLEVEAGIEIAARQRPRALERSPPALPEQRRQPALPHLEHDGEGDVCGGGASGPAPARLADGAAGGRRPLRRGAVPRSSGFRL